MKTAVVTGVSSGIGWGAARALTQNGWKVFGSVRRYEDGARLSVELGSNFFPLVFDVTDEAAVYGAAEIVRQRLNGQRLDGLVNNAGISHNAALTDVAISEVRKVMEVNFFGPLIVTRAFAPLLGTDPTLSGPPGRIINVSSIAGRYAVPFAGAYSTSKHALEALSDTFRREFMLFGIDVIIVGPGAVQTAIWDKIEERDSSIYKASPYYESLQKFNRYGVENGRTHGHTPEQQGEAILHALTARRPQARYATVANRFRNWTLFNILPKRVLDRRLAKKMGLSPRPAK